MRSADLPDARTVGAASAARQYRALGKIVPLGGRLKSALQSALRSTLCAAAAMSAITSAGAAVEASAPVGLPSLPQAPTAHTVNLNGADFFAAWTHTDLAIRERAQLYLLGAMDASEGRTWCSYSRAKSITLHEIVFEHLRQQSSATLRRRASSLIEEGLQTALPCKGKK